MDSISNEISAGATHEVSPRTVRTNWLQFAWSQVSGATKVLLILSITLSLIQIITTIVVLVIGGRDKLGCDKPLQLYLIVFVIRVGVSLPLSIYQHLFVTRQRRGRRRGPNNRINHNRPGESTAENSTLPDTTAHPDTHSTPVITTEQPTQNQPASLISGWAERLKSLLDLFAILWFIVGNYLIFSSYICSSNAALYYYTILTWILLGYTVLVVPLLACASVIFCLPCVLVTMRAFNINISNVMKGGTKEELAKLPIYKYKAPVDSQQNTEQSEITIVNSHPMKKANYFRKFMRRHHDEDSTKKDHTSIPSLTIQKAEDAMCSICLSEYENDELISKLWCNHHYHHSCVIEWLALNTKCPLCKRDFRGKDHISEDLSDNEEEHV